MRALTYEYLYMDGKPRTFRDTWAKGLHQKIKTDFPADMAVMKLTYEKDAPKGLSVITHNHLGGSGNADAAIREDVNYFHFESPEYPNILNPFDAFFPVDVRASTIYKWFNGFIDFYEEGEFVGYERGYSIQLGERHHYRGTLSGHIKGWGWFSYDVESIYATGVHLFTIDPLLGTTAKFKAKNKKKYYNPTSLEGFGRAYDVTTNVAYTVAGVATTVWDAIDAGKNKKLDPFWDPHSDDKVLWTGVSRGFSVGVGYTHVDLFATLKHRKYGSKVMPSNNWKKNRKK